MTPDEMKFWLDVLKSPAVIAIAGGLAGSFITLVVTVLKNRHESKENEKKWQREEERRKEERIFKNKLSAYEEYLYTLKTAPKNSTNELCHHINNSLLKIIIYSPEHVRANAMKLGSNISSIIEKDTESDEYKRAVLNLSKCSDDLYNEIIKDIESHCK